LFEQDEYSLNTLFETFERRFRMFDIKDDWQLKCGNLRPLIDVPERMPEALWQRVQAES
jgi:hypothetical protein